MASPKKLPEALWRNNAVQLWPDLIKALQQELCARNLFDLARSNDVEHLDDQGDLAKNTIQHFAGRFKTSAARIQYVVLDPDNAFQSVSRELNGTLVDGKVAILDIPCGSGGGLLGLIGCLGGLRASRQQPILPLDISVLAGDICTTSHELHNAMVTKLQAPLDSVGIRMSCEYQSWDVTNPLATTQLMDRFNKINSDTSDVIILVSAFSEFASSSEQNSRYVLDAIGDVIKRTHSKSKILAWIEPKLKQDKPNQEGFFSKLWKHVRSIHRIPPSKLPEGTSRRFHYQHPLTEGVLSGTAQVLPIERLGGTQ